MRCQVLNYRARVIDNIIQGDQFLFSKTQYTTLYIIIIQKKEFRK